MAQNASDSQKVDFLWKKIVYGAAKTDISGNIDATNEPNPSPLLIRGDKILQQSDLIANIIPGSNSSVVTVYPTTLPVECTSTAGIPTPTLTWQTGRTFWIPPEFGSTYQIKVYISPSGQAGNVLTKGTQVFATGTTNNDLWVFDYQAGILNFNSNNTPYAGGSPISFTGNSVYISGAVYSGLFGLPGTGNIGNLLLGNITFNGNTISSNQANGNIMIDAPGTGIVQFVGQDAIGLPAGNIITRPSSPYTGYIRFNTEISDIEYWNGTTWTTPAAGVISSDTINPDGVANIFVLSSNSSTLGVMVSINGTLQQPYTSYTIVNNNQIQFTEIPLTTDIVEVRHIVPGTQTVSAESLTLGTTKVDLDTANVNITGNLLPSANVTYDLGSSSLRWRTGYFSANTINIGGGTIGLHDTLGFTFTTPGAQPQYMMPNGASTSNTFTSATVTIQGNLVVDGNITAVGNISGPYLLGSAQFLTGLPIGYSNVNAKAYTESMGFANYSNVNVAAYTQTQSYTNYSNVNVAAYTTTQSYTNYSNVNVAAYVTTNGLTNYSNVNVAAYVTTNGLTNYSNVNVIAYTQTQSYTNYSNVNLSAYLGGSVTIGGNLVVQGNLFVNGNLTTINANNLNIADSMIYLADNNPADTLDIGFVSAFTSAVRYQHTGLVRDATDGVWKLFANVVSEPTTTIDFTNATYSNLQIGNVTAQTANISEVRISQGNITINPGPVSSVLRILNAYGGGFQIDGGGPRLGLGTLANIFSFFDVYSINNNNHINSSNRPLIIGFSTGGAGGNVLYMEPRWGNTVLNTNVASISTTTGAFVVTGGVGVGGNLNVGGNLKVGNIETTSANITGTISQNGIIGGIVPIGGIIMWSGSVPTIPTGWALCNGTNSTPDLRDRFIVGAGGSYANAAVGGTANAIVVSHTHTATVTDPGHFHSYGENQRVQVGNDNDVAYDATSSGAFNTGSNTTGISVTNSTEGSSGTNQNLPPYYALAFIMRIS